MSRALALLVAALLAACEQPEARRSEDGDKPTRIVSLDYCADQYVLKLADRDQILAVSPNASREFSYMRDEAAGLPTVRPAAEDVLVLKPDLVVRSYGGGVNAASFFLQAGVPVLQVGWASNVDDEDVDSIAGLVQHMADGLGQSERGRALVARFRDRLAAVRRRSGNPTALYMTSGGATTGPGSLVHRILLAAGLANFETKPGWRSIPLERLAYERPDLVAAAFFGAAADNLDAWSASRHPVARAQIEEREVVHLKGAWLACGGWYLVEAIEALAAGGRK